jgi:GTP-binding protein
VNAVFVDVARIHTIAGRGGAGCISFRREKFVPKGGPDGGDGGRGGSVRLIVNPHVRTLLDFREQPRYKAESGRPGSGNRRTGRDGADLDIELPPGTVVKDGETGEVLADLVNAGDTFVVARGGRGGRGNARFATSTNQAPRRADPGQDGEQRQIELELKLIADVGFVGLPNAGKSTLLSRISRARPKIADYPFTTLAPNLGIVRIDDERTFVAADLPGLIEDAHLGKGLGLQFLRHVERTRVLLFLLALDSAEGPAQDARTLEHELAEYSEALAGRTRVVALTKADVLAPEDRATAAARAGFPDAHVISAHTGEGLSGLLDQLWSLIAPHGASEGVTHDG